MKICQIAREYNAAVAACSHVTRTAAAGMFAGATQHLGWQTDFKKDELGGNE